MSYDESLAERVRRALGRVAAVEEREMFGGLAFLVGGHMCVGVLRTDFVVRVGPDAQARALRLRHTRVMDFTGRPLRGFVYVSPAGVKSAIQLERWIARGLAFTARLPARSASRRKRARGRR